MSPNSDPETELPLRAGERVTVIGNVDSVSHCHLLSLHTLTISLYAVTRMVWFGGNGPDW